MTGFLVLIASLLWLGGCIYVGRLLSEFTSAVKNNSHELRDLRLTSRTRISDAAVRSGPLSEERLLTRLGRASKSSRVVVGGDADSQLNQDLLRGVNNREDS
jgi:hypothetical protein